MAHAFITINGHEYPQPNRGLDFQVSTAVNAARNANNVVIGQKVGRDAQKINALVWNWLDAETWSKILQEFDTGFYVTVTYPDMVYNTWKTVTMYPGDRSATPYWLDSDTGLPSYYTACKVNIIDCGVMEE